jgi:predicted transcriptional regulator
VLRAALFAFALGIGQPAGPLVLTDQYDHYFRLEDLRGSVVILIVGDRTGSNYMSAWSRGIRARYKAQEYPQLKIVPVANLASVPGFLHGFVKKKFFSKDPSHPASPVQLDWQGAVAQRFGFHDNLTNVYVIDREGMLKHAGSGKGTAAEFDPLFHILDALLRPEP